MRRQSADYTCHHRSLLIHYATPLLPFHYRLPLFNRPRLQVHRCVSIICNRRCRSHVPLCRRPPCQSSSFAVLVFDYVDTQSFLLSPECVFWSLVLSAISIKVSGLHSHRAQI
ncbi:hypothetical protein LINPERHAP1_LOCUS21564 [Linum perenne]